jgi:hypothetical protein
MVIDIAKLARIVLVIFYDSTSIAVDMTESGFFVRAATNFSFSVYSHHLNAFCCCPLYSARQREWQEEEEVKTFPSTASNDVLFYFHPFIPRYSRSRSVSYFSLLFEK